MKKMMFTLIAMLAIAMHANAMSYEQARNEALFLTDKMAYELNLTDAQYEAAYEINLDYLMGVTSRYDVFGTYWERRNMDLQFILYSWQWDLFRAATYFYRPLYWQSGYWHFGIYARYPHRDYFYYGRPHFYVSYRGGHSWHMNGGRSYYEHRHDYYRPHRSSAHIGMRDSWNRGDYRSPARGNSSSTRITGRGDAHNSHMHNDRGTHATESHNSNMHNDRGTHATESHNSNMHNDHGTHATENHNTNAHSGGRFGGNLSRSSHSGNNRSLNNNFGASSSRSMSSNHSSANSSRSMSNNHSSVNNSRSMNNASRSGSFGGRSNASSHQNRASSSNHSFGSRSANRR